MRFPASLALLALAPLPAAAQGAFEGSVSYTMSMASMQMDVIQYVKGDRIRMEMGGPMGNMVTLVDMGTLKTTVLMPATKMYMTMDAQQMAEAAAGAGAGADTEVSIERSGEKQTIAGYSCENVRIRMDDQAINYCITTEFGYFFGGGTPSGAGGRGRGASGNAGQLTQKAMNAIRKEFPKGFFPLKMDMTVNGTAMTMTASKVERKAVPASMFELPKDYTEMSMGGRGRGGN